MTQITALADVTLWRADVSAKTVWLLLRLRDGAGQEGWGEATSFGNEAEISGLAAHLSDLVQSGEVRGVQPLLAALHQSEIAPGRRALLSALEQAGLDLAAHAVTRCPSTPISTAALPIAARRALPPAPGR